MAMARDGDNNNEQRRQNDDSAAVSHADRTVQVWAAVKLVDLTTNHYATSNDDSLSRKPLVQRKAQTIRNSQSTVPEFSTMKDYECYSFFWATTPCTFTQE